MKLLAAVLALPLIGGCYGPHEPNGFIDPTAVGRFNDRKPLVVPILSHLDVGMEEANREFSSATEIKPEDLETKSQDYVIAANDLLNISISDLAGPGVEQVKQSRVTESGRVSLPMIGQIPATGMTEAELEKQISAAYKQAGMIQNAQVSVAVVEARGRTFSLAGPGVQRGGQYAIYKGDFRLIDALVASGESAAQTDYIYVIRDRKPAAGAGEANKPAGTTDNTNPAGNLEPAPNPGADLEPKTPAPATTPSPAPDLTPGATPAPAPTTPPSGRAPVAAPFAEVILAAADTVPAPAATAPAPSGEGRIVIIDGKPVLIEGGQSQVNPAPAPNPAAEVKPAPQGEPGAQPQQPQATPPALVPPAGPDGQPTATTPTTEPFEFSGTSPDDKRIIRVNMRQLRSGDLGQNIAIRPGDTLWVPGPVVGEYYMGGHVGTPGVFSLTGRDITLTQAIVSARMFDQLAVPRRTDIIRRLGTDRQVTVSVDLDNIFAGLAPDIYLKPNDVVNVGTSAWAPFLASIRGAFRFTYGFGFIYDRNYAAKENNAGTGR